MICSVKHLTNAEALAELFAACLLTWLKEMSAYYCLHYAHIKQIMGFSF